MSEDVEFNTKGLDKLLKAFKDIPKARVGILGGKNPRQNGGSNASVGAKHEFGDPASGLPIRSFLRVPITEHLQEYLDKSKAFDQDALKKVISESSLREWVAKIGIVAETIVLDGFQTGGFGKWKPSNMLHKKNQQTLVETQQLRNSITSEVK